MVWCHISLYGKYQEIGVYGFGAIFPYMVMVGTRGIWFSAIREYYRCRFIV